MAQIWTMRMKRVCVMETGRICPVWAAFVNMGNSHIKLHQSPILGSGKLLPNFGELMIPMGSMKDFKPLMRLRGVFNS